MFCLYERLLNCCCLCLFVFFFTDYLHDQNMPGLCEAFSAASPHLNDVQWQRHHQPRSTVRRLRKQHKRNAADATASNSTASAATATAAATAASMVSANCTSSPAPLFAVYGDGQSLAQLLRLSHKVRNYVALMPRLQGARLSTLSTDRQLDELLDAVDVYRVRVKR